MPKSDGNAAGLVGDSFTNRQQRFDQPIAFTGRLMSVRESERAFPQAKLQQIGDRPGTQRTKLLRTAQYVRRRPCRLRNHVLEAHAQAQEFRHHLRHGDQPRTVDAVPMKIRADGVGPEMILKSALRGLPGKTSTTVSDVEDNSPFPRPFQLGDEAFWRGRNHPVRAPVKTVGKNVAWPKVIEHVGFVRASTDVRHNRHFGLARRFEREIESIVAVTRRHRSQPDLDSDGNIAVPRRDNRGLSGTCVSQVQEFFGKGAVEAHERNVHEGQNSCAAGLDRSSAKFGEIREARCSCIDSRGHAVIQADLRVNSVEPAFVPMAVQVHQAGAI